MLKSLLTNYPIKKYDFRNATTSSSSSSSSSSSHILNNFPIYVINLKHDKIRRNYIKALFKRHHINFSLIVVEKFEYKTTEDILNLKMKKSILGCLLSHLWCIQHAIKLRHKQFLIFEDDIIFHKNFENMFATIMETHFHEIDLLMLGALDINLRKNLPTLFEDGGGEKGEGGCVYYPTHNVLGGHANLYKIEFAKQFLEYKLNASQPLEFDFDYLGFMSTHKIGICMPNLVICELSTTNLEHDFCPLNALTFDRYRRYFPANFTYDDYEYIPMLFLQTIQEYMAKYDDKKIATLEEMLDVFRIKHSRRNTPLMCTAISNSGYTVERVVEMICLANRDKQG